MSKMKLRSPDFPVLGIGSGSLANAGGEEAFAQVISRAWEQGVRYFDTSAFYLGGESERRLGAALNGFPKDEAMLSTKVGRYQNHTGPSVDPQNKKSFFDFSYDTTMQSVEPSLQRLRGGHLDAVYIHDLDHRLCGSAYPDLLKEALEGAYLALQRLKYEGLVKGVGVAAMDWRACHEFASLAELDVVMPAGEYSLIRNACTPLLNHCLQNGIAWIAASPFNSGILATGATDTAFYDMRRASRQALKQVADLEKLCKRHGVHLPAAALQYPLRNLAVQTVVAGAKFAVELNLITRFMQEFIAEDFWREVQPFIEKTLDWECE